MDYSDDWYQDDIKDDGGWTLELKNPENPCDITIGNWSASSNPLGGTPGQQNSNFDTSSSGTLVQLLNAETIDPFQVQLNFSTALNNTVLNTINYTIDNGVGNPDNILLLNPSTIIMEFNTALSGNVSYNVIVNNINDCTGENGMDTNANSASFQLPEPTVLSAMAQFPSQTIIVTYDMPMDAASAQNVSNYTLDGTVNPSTITVLGPFTVELTFVINLVNGTSYDLEVSDVTNADGTMIDPNPSTVSFVYFEPVEVERYDIIINEFMPDPADRVGLPELEFVELYNRSNKVISLEGYTLQSGSSSSSSLPFIVLQPNDYAIVSKVDDEMEL